MRKYGTFVGLSLFGVALFAGVAAAAGEMFAGLDGAKQIYGKKITLDDLKGKVVFLEYWGNRCPPCRASFPHLIKLQRKFANTGKFTVLASHVQRSETAAVAFCKSQGVNFPVFQQFREPLAPCGRGIPSAFLIDHNGKIVQQGHPSTLYDAVKDLVKSTPDPPPPILGDVKPKYWVKYANALAAGKTIAPIRKILKQASTAQTPRGKEAKALLQALDDYLIGQKKELSEMAETKPSLACLRLKSYLKQLSGLPQEREFRKIYAKLASDSSVKALMSLRLEMSKLRARQERRDTRFVRRKLRDLGYKMEKLSEKKGVSPAVAKEAKDLADSL